MTSSSPETSPAIAPARPPRPASMEITPNEYEHYLRQAQMMRAEHMAAIIDGWFSGFRRLFRRERPVVKPAPINVAAQRTA